MKSLEAREELFSVENDFSDLPNVGNTVELDKKFDVFDTNKDGIVDEEEEKEILRNNWAEKLIQWKSILHTSMV